ncbi:MAG: mechanosensitive ion channel [Desulfuromonadales bacterium]|jgi:small conductance mechanosensitive channel
MRPSSLRTSLILGSLVLLLGLSIPATLAAQDAATEPAQANVDTKQAEALQESHAQIAEQRELIRSLQDRTDGQQGIYKKVLDKRLDRATLELLERGVAYAKQVAALEEDAPDRAKERAQAADILARQYRIGLDAIADLRTRITPPDQALSGAELAAVYIDILDAQELVNGFLKNLVDNLELAKELTEQPEQNAHTLKTVVEDIAVARSILLELETEQLKVLRERAKTAPDDQELKGKLAVVNKNLKQLAGNFSPVLDLMDRFEMETALYREQILNATGTLSADTAEIDVVKDLLVRWGEAFWNFLIEDGPDLLFKAFVLLLILFAAHKLGNLLKRIVEKGLESSRLQVSELLRRMILSLVRNIVLILGLLIAISQMGISLGPLLAGFGIIGFVVGFALQDSLANFASGFMILVYRPYDVGDIIESGGMLGRVNNMSFVNTTIITFDNQNIIIPNSKIWNDVIKNVTSQTHRRVDMVFGIAYSDDVEKAEQVLMQILKDHEKVLEEPEPVVRLHELGDSSVNFIVRPWVLKEDYWEVYWDVTRTVKLRFDEVGLSIPFPQRDVHLYPQVAENRQQEDRAAADQETRG